MCIAIVKPAGKWVSHESLSNSFAANPHGAGYAFLKDGVMVIKKGFFDFKKFFKAYSKDVSVETIAMVHFRIATKGAKDEANCHPFAIDNGAMMHNGPCINYTKCSGDKERSDTRQFAEDFVKTLSREQIVGIRPMIESFAGSEKIAFLFNDGEYVICNEKEGLWSEGCWYSNTSFRGFYNTSGRPYRNDNWSHSGNNYNYDPTTGRYGSSNHASGAQGSQAGSTTTGAPANLATVIKRSFGVGSPLYDCRWSQKLVGWVPQEIIVDNSTRMIWNELYGAYLPFDAVNHLCSDKRYVYEATDKAEQRTSGPNVKLDDDWVIVGDILVNEHDLRVFLHDAAPYVKPAPAPAPAAAPVAAAPETAPATSTTADASAVNTSETVH